jgi:hypothetical protein
MLQKQPVPKDEISTSIAEKKRICEEFKKACEEELGSIVATHQDVIMSYYCDVLEQAKQSFKSAKNAAIMGFAVLIVTLLYYIFLTDNTSRIPKTSMSQPSITVAEVGLISGGLIEFIAGVNFWLYARASKQFSAFHICLERTHRYLIAYEISKKIANSHRDETLENLVCIMANAPMITRSDIDNIQYQPINAKSSKTQVISSEAEEVTR